MKREHDGFTEWRCTCVECKTRFWSKFKDAKFCTMNCGIKQATGRTKYVEVTCIGCKKRHAKLRCPFCNYARKSVARNMDEHQGDVE